MAAHACDVAANILFLQYSSRSPILKACCVSCSERGPLALGCPSLALRRFLLEIMRPAQSEGERSVSIREVIEIRSVFIILPTDQTRKN
jgi:hypothetical protein